ncbi:uncharacterized protein TNCV_931471 [Trichonephila clavipes]|uniref:Transposase n=1 Tax=Trichonephila clavipes TaxID=2585209 RepID=A0A8X6W344_TRICX|nr:uncharacterized protein TNCV_931471 [Trichonephila clavipes]
MKAVSFSHLNHITDSTASIQIYEVIRYQSEKLAGAVGSLVVRASDSRPEGLGSMLDVTKYPPSAHGFTCRNCGGGDKGRVAIYRPLGEVSLSLNRTVTCMVLKANDRRTSCPCHDEFRGPRSDYVRQFGLAILQTDNQARCRFVEWAQNEIAVVPDFHKRLLFSDEAHFWLNGNVNIQNCRILSEANPLVYVETPLHPSKLTVALYGLVESLVRTSSKTMKATTLQSMMIGRRAMIINFFIPELNNHDVQELCFQQDGATRRTARDTTDLLKDTFGDRII